MVKLVAILYHKSNENLMETEAFKQFFLHLPPFLQEKIGSYRKWQDQQRCIIGNMLVVSGLQFLGLTSLSLHNLKYTAFQRPYLHHNIDFNVSHAGDFTICAVSETTRVGIDIEKIEPIDIEVFKTQLTRAELDEISQAYDSTFCFYQLWTKKEAFSKALGTGLSSPLTEIKLVHNKVQWKAREWFLHEIKLEKGYVCYLCTTSSAPEIIQREIQF